LKKGSKTHKDLEIWQKGVDLVTKIYEITKNFPKEEIYGLTSQMRRAAISYPSNIAEGAARNSLKEYIRFLYISQASLSELETHLIISKNLNYTSDVSVFIGNIEMLRRKTHKLIKYFKEKKNNDTPTDQHTN
jgi:four helix bundle protein